MCFEDKTFRYRYLPDFCLFSLLEDAHRAVQKIFLHCTPSNKPLKIEDMKVRTTPGRCKNALESSPGSLVQCLLNIFGDSIKESHEFQRNKLYANINRLQQFTKLSNLPHTCRWPNLQFWFNLSSSCLFKCSRQHDTAGVRTQWKG